MRSSSEILIVATVPMIPLGIGSHSIIIKPWSRIKSAPRATAKTTFAGMRITAPNKVIYVTKIAIASAINIGAAMTPITSAGISSRVNTWVMGNDNTDTTSQSNMRLVRLTGVSRSLIQSNGTRRARTNRNSDTKLINCAVLIAIVASSCGARIA